jgi:hypothetical protein
MAAIVRRGGKRHARATRANDTRLADYMDALRDATNREALTIYMTDTTSQLARVIKNHGGRQLEVQLQDGTTIKARVSGTLSTRGCSTTKAHLDYVMTANDLILITGGMAAAKVPKGLYKHIQARFSDLKVSTPAGFFTIGEIKDEEEAEDNGWEWDTSLEAAKAEAAIARARARSDKAGPAGGAGDASDDETATGAEADIDVDAI